MNISGVFLSMLLGRVPVAWKNRTAALNAWIKRGGVVAGCLLLLAACVDPASMPGEVASVNGRGISFREVEARRVTRFTGLAPQGKAAEDDSLQEQYRYVVQQIVEELLICQYMESKGLTLEHGALEAEERLIRDDYPKGGFERMLVDDGISLELWRENLRRRLLINRFIAQVLRPEIVISPEDVQQYYQRHSNEFIIPEQWHFMQITGLDRKEVENARTRFLADKNATAAQENFLVTIHDIRMGVDRLPEAVQKELTSLSPGKASPVRPHEDEFRVFVMLEKIPSSMLEAAEMYKRVEQALVEENLQSVYMLWVQKHLAKADIRMDPVLLPSRTGETSASSALSKNEPGRNATKSVPALLDDEQGEE